jgi:hypothetical protein
MTPGDIRERSRQAWVYESIVDAIPILSLSPRVAVTVQFVGFELALLGLAAIYDLWTAVPAGTVAILVAAVGSWFMHDLGRRIREVSVPSAYRRLLFDSSIEVVLGVAAYAALLTYLFVLDPRSGGTLLEALLGSNPPLLAVYLLLVVLWDVTYRIGTGWWAAVVSFWRTLRFDLDPTTKEALGRVDRRTMVFALIQLAFLPFLGAHPLLGFAVAGHVLAVLLVVGTSLALQTG